VGKTGVRNRGLCKTRTTVNSHFPITLNNINQIKIFLLRTINKHVIVILLVKIHFDFLHILGVMQYVFGTRSVIRVFAHPFYMQPTISVSRGGHNQAHPNVSVRAAPDTACVCIPYILFTRHFLEGGPGYSYTSDITCILARRTSDTKPYLGLLLYLV
jgi:hypothetical protein